jgi:hypothetical protein
MPQMTRTPGRHTTRRIEQPTGLPVSPGVVTMKAEALAAAHNKAVREYGSDSGGYHAFDPSSSLSAGVWERGSIFPHHTVVTPLAWGRIDRQLAQRVLHSEGIR